MDLGKYPINRVVSLTTKSQKGKFQCIQNTLLLSLHINIIYPYNCSDFKAVLAAQQNIPHHSKGDLLSLLLQQTSKMAQLDNVEHYPRAKSNFGLFLYSP